MLSPAPLNPEFPQVGEDAVVRAPTDWFETSIALSSDTVALADGDVACVVFK
jgi:hypothetical protein